MRHFKEPARGYCPYLRRDHTIIIEYAELLLAGGQPRGEKTVGFSCDYLEKCGQENACPVREEALEERHQR